MMMKFNADPNETHKGFAAWLWTEAHIDVAPTAVAVVLRYYRVFAQSETGKTLREQIRLARVSKQTSKLKQRLEDKEAEWDRLARALARQQLTGETTLFDARAKFARAVQKRREEETPEAEVLDLDAFLDESEDNEDE
ncbi:MAG: hypothetical protein ACRDQA_02410 [Nocardioidaceae bacterium]